MRKRKLEKTNPELLQLVRVLEREGKKLKARIWLDTAERLMRPKRRRIIVNVGHINKHTEENDTIIVPGKVLGDGFLDHPVKVAAFKFSEKAKNRIEAAGGKWMSILDLLRENPKGSNVKIIG